MTGSCKQRFLEADLDWLAVGKAEVGGIRTREVFNEYVSSFDCIVKYLNCNEVIIGTPASVKQSFLKGLEPRIQERVQRRMYDSNLIQQSRDGGTLLRDLKEI